MKVGNGAQPDYLEAESLSPGYDQGVQTKQKSQQCFEAKAILVQF